jgi:hypothetical protein
MRSAFYISMNPSVNQCNLLEAFLIELSDKSKVSMTQAIGFLP